MAVHIEREDIDGVTVLRLSGEMLGHLALETLRNNVGNLAAHADARFVCNLTAVTEINANGYAALVALSRWGRRTAFTQSGFAKLDNLLERHKLFPVFDTEAEAIEYVRQYDD